MDELIRSDDIVLLLDHDSPDSRDLMESFRKAGFCCPAAVIEDEGFLGDDVISVYGFFLGSFKGEKGVPGRPRYFNEIQVPDRWEISGTNFMGKIHDLYRERGRIFYAEPLHRRLVKTVDWYDERGIVRSSDHYNRYGALYARTTFNEKGKRVNKSWFSAAGREIIVENYITGDIILNDGDQVRFFPNKTDFVLFVLRAAGFDKNRLFYNSLSTPFFVSQRLHAPYKRDILFWQEPVKGDIPGNMQIILNGQASRTAKIMVQKRQAYEELVRLGASPETVKPLGFIYSFEKENLHRPEALICTNSDQIEHLQEIVEAVPQMRFHIAALTEMSSKLTAMDRYENVRLYPGVKMSMLEDLFDSCDYYLDINRGNEIVSAVRRAFLHNHLIFAFREIMHGGDYTAAGRLYGLDEAGRMIGDMRTAMEDGEKLEEWLEGQRKAAMAETGDGYLQFEEKKRRVVKENPPVTMYITGLWGVNPRERSAITQSNVVKTARELGFTEMTIHRRKAAEGDEDGLRRQAREITSTIKDNDIVVFQSPSWNGDAFDRELVKEIRRHRNIRLCIFIHDVTSMMTGGTESDYRETIENYNMADLIIVPTEDMLNFLRKREMTVKKTLIQPMWDLPFGEELRTPEFSRRILFSGSPEKFGFVSGWDYDLPLWVFADGKFERNGGNVRFEGWKNTTDLLIEYTRGGFGLVWSGGQQPDYYKSSQPHKLSGYLAAGIPVIIQRGLPHAQTVEDYELGYVVDSLDEAASKVTAVTEAEYRRLAENTGNISNLIKGGFFTKKLLVDAVNYLMLG